MPCFRPHVLECVYNVLSTTPPDSWSTDSLLNPSLTNSPLHALQVTDRLSGPRVPEQSTTFTHRAHADETARDTERNPVFRNTGSTNPCMDVKECQTDAGICCSGFLEAGGRVSLQYQISGCINEELPSGIVDHPLRDTSSKHFISKLLDLQALEIRKNWNAERANSGG